MRKLFVSHFLELAQKDERVLLLSGDLGFMALEEIQKALGSRFINAGVAEQNMVSVAAGLAAKGFQPWVYSIAPFITLRPYEQLRNDVCHHDLPVRVVGNGGGFGYGIMGFTHHVLEDIGCMRLLGMQVLVPAYQSDVRDLVQAAHDEPGPVYLRLGKSLQGDCPDRSPVWRHLVPGDQATVVSTGPVVGELLGMLRDFPEKTLDVFSVARFPFGEVPQTLLESLKRTRRLIVLEEHLQVGGLGESLVHDLATSFGGPFKLLSLNAKGYPSGKYGSQRWHLEDNGLAGSGLFERLQLFLSQPHDR